MMLSVKITPSPVEGKEEKEKSKRRRNDFEKLPHGACLPRWREAKYGCHIIPQLVGAIVNAGQSLAARRLILCVWNSGTAAVGNFVRPALFVSDSISR